MITEKIDQQEISSFCLRIPKELKIELDNLSKLEKRSTNKQILIAIEKCVDENKQRLSF